MRFLASFFLSVVSVSAFTPPIYQSQYLLSLSSSEDDDEEFSDLEDGFQFDIRVREWNCNYSEDDGSLLLAQIALDSVLEDLKAEVDGSVHCAVCEDRLEFKVVTSANQDAFDAWKSNDFEPEEIFLEMLGNIDGISSIESQTYEKAQL
mmetsp:Transcript_28435/g.42030  ORF Transcript_28435/g.42030 Transcript_28435/m.42030 type:complete len:149 (-) Transcript_28435:195-641(-)|eukprot:CAMPEP_0194213332 /NCGR_PEP_ID=MMETSP0156-20130528/13806_1 /TAXON_ID=33649 /ORGANISM="Thalassionema nitzschioides, Strain L26-B" /LENGTH=148 /DNA_ID=CAMNT_0038941329 /DNA_START=160 /DNA_END=606 /DNA_ORIENTATION=+